MSDVQSSNIVCKHDHVRNQELTVHSNDYLSSGVEEDRMYNNTNLADILDTVNLSFKLFKKVPKQ